MNRVEFMETLSRLLQDIPEEDRIDALKYYNDYFDDAGSENEQNVIEELESPEKVAMKIKATGRHRRRQRRWNGKNNRRSNRQSNRRKCSILWSQGTA